MNWTRRALALATTVVAAGATLALTPVAANAAASDVPGNIQITATAHRGANWFAPENTIAAFELAIDQGADLIESDVQRTKDGELVLLHDVSLARTTNVEEVFPDRAPWNVFDFTLAEIKQLDAGSWKGPEFAGEQVPTLGEMVETVRNSPTGITMELKNPSLYPGIEAEVAAEFDSYPGYVKSAISAGRLEVQSFDWESMRIYEEVQPEMPVGLLGKPTLEQLQGELAWADQVHPGFGDINGDTAWIDGVHALGKRVLTWTLNTEELMHAALDQGVDGIESDNMELLQQVLLERAGGR